jgi:hypothetical protein
MRPFKRHVISTEHYLETERHVISTEGGAFAAAVERPLYFAFARADHRNH